MDRDKKAAALSAILAEDWEHIGALDIKALQRVLEMYQPIPEPPVGSVVRARNGTFWLRSHTGDLGWVSSGGNWMTWALLSGSVVALYKEVFNEQS